MATIRVGVGFRGFLLFQRCEVGSDGFFDEFGSGSVAEGLFFSEAVDLVCEVSGQFYCNPV